MALESICNVKYVPSNLDGKKDAVIHLESDEIAEDLEDGEIAEDDEEEIVGDTETTTTKHVQEAPPPDTQKPDSPKERSGRRSATGGRAKKGEERKEGRSKRRKHHKKRRHEAEPEAPIEGKRSRRRSGLIEEGEDGDDDEMLFVRGASPSGQSPKNQEHFPPQDFDYESGDHSGDEFNNFIMEEGGRRNKRMGKFREGGDKRGGPKDRNIKKKRKDKASHPIIESRKRENCMFFMQGKCQKGDECPYMHNGSPQRKLELCKFYLMDCCAKRDKCLYMHSDFPCKFFHTGMKCFSGDTCKFSHDSLSDVTRQILLKHIETAPKEILGDFPRLPRDRNGDIKLPESGLDENGALVAAALQQLKKIPSLFEIKIEPPPELSNLLVDNGASEIRADQDEREMQQQQLQQQQQHQQQQQQQHHQNRPRNTRPTGYYLDSNRHSNNEEEEEEEEEDSDNDDFETQLRKRMEAQRLERERKEQAESLKLKEQEAALRQELLREEELEQAKKEKAEAPLSFYQETLEAVKEERKRIHDYRRSLTDDDDDEDQLVMATQDDEPEEDTSSKLPDESEEEENEDESSVPKHLPKKQQELFFRIQQQQAQRAAAEEAAAKELAEQSAGDAQESQDDEKQEENWYSSDDDDEGGKSVADLLKNLSKQPATPTPVVEVPPTPSISAPVTAASLDKLNLSHINISADLTKLLSSIQSKSEEKNTRSRDPRALRDPRASVKVETKSPSASPVDVDLRMLPPSSNKDMDLRTNVPRVGDTDFRQQGCFGDTDLRDVSLLGLPFKPAPLHAPCTEIDASIASHPPVEFKIVPAEVKCPDYSYLKLDLSDSHVRNDPRLKKLVTKLEVTVSPMSPPPVVEVPRADPRSRSNPQQQQVSTDPRKARMAASVPPPTAPPVIPINPLPPQMPLGFPPNLPNPALLAMINPQLLGAALMNPVNPLMNINRSEGLLGPAPIMLEGGLMPDPNRLGLLVPPAGISPQHEADYGGGGFRGRRGRGNWEPRGRGRGGRNNWDSNRDRSTRRNRYDVDREDPPRHRSPNRRGYNSPNNRERRHSPAFDSPSSTRSHRNFSPQHRQTFTSPRDDGGSFTPPRSRTPPRGSSFTPPRDDSGSFTPPR